VLFLLLLLFILPQLVELLVVVVLSLLLEVKLFVVDSLGRFENVVVETDIEGVLEFCFWGAKGAEWLVGEGVVGWGVHLGEEGEWVGGSNRRKGVDPAYGGCRVEFVHVSEGSFE